MFITKRALEKRIQEAKEQAIADFERRQWERDCFDRVNERIDKLYKRLSVLEEKVLNYKTVKVEPGCVSKMVEY